MRGGRRESWEVESGDVEDRTETEDEDEAVTG